MGVDRHRPPTRLLGGGSDSYACGVWKNSPHAHLKGGGGTVLKQKPRARLKSGGDIGVWGQRAPLVLVCWEVVVMVMRVVRGRIHLMLI